MLLNTCYARRDAFMTQTIEHLKRLTASKGADFGQCLNYFLDLTMEDQFLNAGRRYDADDSFYRALLKPVCEFFGEEVGIVSILLVSMKQHQFMHGSATLSNLQMVVFYYFEDIQCGMASAAVLGGSTNIFRITLLKEMGEKLVIH